MEIELQNVKEKIWVLQDQIDKLNHKKLEHLIEVDPNLELAKELGNLSVKEVDCKN